MTQTTTTGNANRLTQEEYVSGRTLENRIEQLQDATTRYTWDVTRSFGVLLSESTGNITTDYDYGFERISSLTGNTKTEYLYDPRGSVAVELRYSTAQTADSVRSQIEISVKVYNPFGEQLDSKQSGFGYNGESYDAATGSVYLRARYYEPALNRFSQKDIDRGTVTNPKSLNRYLYTWNNPVSYVDLDGQRVALPLNLGGGSSSKKATATTPLPSTSKPTPVAFQEQPVSTSASKVQSAVTTAAPAITPAMQKNLAAAAAVGAVGNTMVSSNMAAKSAATAAAPVMTGAVAGKSLLNNLPTRPQASDIAESTPVVESPVNSNQTCGKGKTIFGSIVSFGNNIIERTADFLSGLTPKEVFVSVASASWEYLNTMFGYGVSAVQGTIEDLGSYIAAERAAGRFGNHIIRATGKMDECEELLSTYSEWQRTLEYVGIAGDFVSQLVAGEEVGHATIKTAGHYLISAGVAALAAAYLPAVPLVAFAAAVATYGSTIVFDKLYDDYVRNPLDNLWNKITFVFG